ncbi:MAG: hypothetical protein GXP42_11555 [Chloroflexi bacterium]|nr:hypothetical protein [Chloroflexota bacterium]
MIDEITLGFILLITLVIAVGALAVVWWVRRSGRGLEWVLLAIPLALGASYLSSFLFRVPDYQAGCAGVCRGWWGHPLPTHISDGVGGAIFLPVGFALNAAAYYVAILLFSIFVALMASYFRWSERGRRWRLFFVIMVVFVPLALAPSWASPPQPNFPLPEQRLVINAERAWRWQLLAKSVSQRRLAAEDVRLHPDGERHRVCFRIYTWFYLPYRRAYVDLEPAGVRATGGGLLPLDASCWIQP